MGVTGRVIVAIAIVYLLTLTFPEAEGSSKISKDYRKAKRMLTRAQNEKTSIWAEFKSIRRE